jgi:glucosamine 6-phosphate synthetase-like amidotransferase/phosphosugar isomerase protein
MCGIVGYVGKQDAVPLLLDGLKRLEYRGYDSAGIAIAAAGYVSVQKSVGRLSALEERLTTQPLYGQPGIGHTRWATHGAPTEINAHPHYRFDSAAHCRGAQRDHRELPANCAPPWKPKAITSCPRPTPRSSRT